MSPRIGPQRLLVLLALVLWGWLAGSGLAISAPLTAPIPPATLGFFGSSYRPLSALAAPPDQPRARAENLPHTLLAAAPDRDRPRPLEDAASEMPQTPAQLFELHCAGCHVNGGNIIRRGKNLKARALARNGIDSPAAVATLIRQGKGLMSAYGDRFTPDQVEALAAYVWQRSQENWR